MQSGQLRTSVSPVGNLRSSHLTQESGLHRSPSRASNASRSRVQYGHSADLDTLQRAPSPVSSVRHTENSLLANAHHNERYTASNYETDPELSQEADIFAFENKSSLPIKGQNERYV